MPNCTLIEFFRRFFLKVFRKVQWECVFAKSIINFIISEATEVGVLVYFEAYRGNSIRHLVKNYNLSYGIIPIILRKLVIHKYRPVQALMAGKSERNTCILSLVHQLLSTRCE